MRLTTRPQGVASLCPGFGWTLPLAEIEQMACVMTSVGKGFFRWSRTYLLP